MSITYELRKEAQASASTCFYVYTAEQAERLTAIADRIDAAHNRAVMSAMNDALYHANDESMAELGWVRLPKDADGVPIHAGDTLDGYGKTIEVVEMRYGRGGWVLISRDGSGYADTFAFAHHHEPTVEDVLRDVVTLCHNIWKEWSAFEFYDVDDVMKSNSIAEYAAKLRLVGDAV